MFSVFITHHSKIRELSDGNKNWKQNPTSVESWVPHHFWVMSYENRVISYGNQKSKHPLNIQFCSSMYWLACGWRIQESQKRKREAEDSHHTFAIIYLVTNFKII